MYVISYSDLLFYFLPVRKEPYIS